ncbi:MAG: choice-of-anchor I family protein [Pseudomonadota bacterium]
MSTNRLLVAAVVAAASSASALADVSLVRIGTVETGVFDDGAAEIVTYSPTIESLFVINAAASTVDIIDISSPQDPVLTSFIDVAPDIAEAFPGEAAGGVNSVATHGNLVAIAVENDDTQANGWAAFYDTAGTFLGAIEAGPLPDSVAITRDGRYALTANEGEPSDDYRNDPEGSITIIDLAGGVANATAMTADFSGFDLDDIPAGARVPRAVEGFSTVAQDLEPEFITTSITSRIAWVTLQENNAIAVVDIPSATVLRIAGLGAKDHMDPDNALDPSDRDDAIAIANWPVQGLYMPDSIASFVLRGRTFLVTANEGDGREYFFDVDPADIPPGKTAEEACLEDLGGLDFDEDDGCLSYIDEARIKDLTLDPTAFPNAAELQADEALGRLLAVTTEGDTDGDGDYDELYSFGARSISVWTAGGTLLSDTGSVMEDVTAEQTLFCDGELELCSGFNSTNDENDSFDSRSDAKGPEPEGVAVGTNAFATTVFVTLERVGGIMIFDVSRPREPEFLSYFNDRNFDPAADAEAGEVGDLGPEGIVFISGPNSPNGLPLLVVGNEVSGTTSIYQVVRD